MQKNNEQRIFIVVQYLLTGSRISVRKAFANEFRENVDVKTVHRVMEKWSPTKPEEVYEKPLHSPKVTVWSGLSSNRIYGPYFFEDPERNARTVTTETYIEMLNMMFVNDIYPDQWFQQDGATAHTSLRAREWLTN